MSKVMGHQVVPSPAWLLAVTSQPVTHTPDLDSTPEPWKEPVDGVNSFLRHHSITRPTQPVPAGSGDAPFPLPGCLGTALSVHRGLGRAQGHSVGPHFRRLLPWVFSSLRLRRLQEPDSTPSCHFSPQTHPVATTSHGDCCFVNVLETYMSVCSRFAHARLLGVSEELDCGGKGLFHFHLSADLNEKSTPLCCYDWLKGT